jgi:hypothetical protein
MNIVIKVKERIDALYSDGRTTLIGDDELTAIIESVSPRIGEDNDNQ